MYTATQRYAAYITMELVNRHRPHRAVIRCKAKMQLMETTEGSLDCNGAFDDVLLKDLAAGLFRSSQYRVFFEKCHSKQEVKEVEDQLAQELAHTYQKILERSQDPVVQGLNALLSAVN